MGFRRFLQKLFGRTAVKPLPARAEMQASPSEMMEKLVAMLDRTQATELGCDEVFALLDQFAELAARGEDVGRLMPLVKQHVDMCADCQEEYQVLAKILESSA